MQQSKTTLPMMHAPIIPRQCQLTKYTYPTLSPAGQNSATKSRVDQSPTNTPPPHLTRQHTRDTHVFNTAQPHVPTRAQPRNHLVTTPTTQVPRREHGQTPFTITITIICPRLLSHINRIRNTLFIASPRACTNDKNRINKTRTCNHNHAQVSCLSYVTHASKRYNASHDTLHMLALVCQASGYLNRRPPHTPLVKSTSHMHACRPVRGSYLKHKNRFQKPGKVAQAAMVALGAINRHWLNLPTARAHPFAAAIPSEAVPYFRVSTNT